MTDTLLSKSTEEEILLSKSNWWKTACLNAVLRGGTNFTAPQTVYIALYTSNPTDVDTGQEVSGGGYERRVVTFGAPVIADRRATTSSTTDVYFPIATADWGLVTHIGIRTAATGGNLLYHGAVTNPRTVQTNDSLRFMAGRINIDEG
ncbi:hypothetical protein MJ749_13265 [Paenibacillus polymyxa]|uniref:phage tail fiber protein n=1 Tax=Paenibacillus polymyxa TaxID=1406 RepID=UPI001F106151|nr:hypothetical protein [Paenibacillus polymyxa]UMR33669.1 hypothetical protein MJ749_13265 [Paenibacillus polymyxa]